MTTGAEPSRGTAATPEQPAAEPIAAPRASVGREAGQRAHPAVTVDVVVLTVRDRRLEVVLVKRRNWPFEGMWAIPGRFVDPEESLEGAAMRKLEEKTGARDVYLEQLYTFGDPERDPRMRVITVVYYALIRPDQLRPPVHGDGPDTQLFWAYDLPPLAFDHQKILHYTLQRLRAKLEYTNLGFQLLSDEFTMSELQEVYEAILNRRLDKRNFRKKLLMTRIVEPTQHTKMVGPHRPALLYRFNPDANT